MKSSSGINIGNANNGRKNRKPSTTSFSPSSTSVTINKRLTKTNITNAEHDDIKRQQQQLNDFIQPAQSFYTTSISSFQSESLLSKYQFELTPETIHSLNQKQRKYLKRRQHIQWISNHATIPTAKSNNPNKSSPIIFTTKSIPMTTNIKKEILNIPNVSIKEMTTKDFHEQYHAYIDSSNNNNNQDELDQTLKYSSINVVTDDEEEEEEDKKNNNNVPDDNDKEKLFVDQGIQALVEDTTKPEKKIKSATYHKKIKSATKRPKQPSATQVAQGTSLSSSPTRTTTQLDSTTVTVTKLASSTIKFDDNNGGKTIVTVDTSKARSNLEVVRLCVRELGWKECPLTTNVDSDIYWHSSSFHEGNTNFAFNSGRVNKFPGMNDLLRKVHLTRSLNNMRLLFPNDFDFYPKTWFLPEQTQQFKDDVRYIHQQDKKHNRSLTTFIVKPSDGSQGEGIYLLRDPAHCIVTNRPHVVQEYIERPLLMNGLKFDLRIYVLILNLYPLELFLYDEGLVRFATVDYKAPSTENLHETYMHLTNYSLNKRSASYKHTFDNKQTDGSKRKLSTVWTQLSNMFGSDRIERTKTLIIEMINKTILAVLPELRVEYEFELPLGKKQNISCFQIVGFDIILTDHLKPILLEVNANPSLRIDFDKETEAGKVIYQASPIDEEIKKPLILETLKLALPKKKLHALTRHAQLQVNDELMVQRVEKVAQRRVEERNERLKSERKNRFDTKANPLFSRPPELITKEFARLQQEQREVTSQQRVLITTPTNLMNPLETTENNQTPPVPTKQSSPTNDTKSKPTTATTTKIVRKTKKLFDSTDDDESGSPVPPANETPSNPRHHPLYHSQSASIKRPVIKSATTRHIPASDAAMVGSIKKMKIIFPLNYRSKYRHLFLLDKIAYIYIQLVIMLGHKTMTGRQFRSFATICGIIDETITAPSIDILYYQILRKWQQFVLRTNNSSGLPFTAFIETFFLLSQRKYPSTHSLLDSVSQLVGVCVHNLNSCLQAPSSPLIQQSNQYLLHRATRINSSTNPSSSLHNRSSIIALRSTTAGTTRPSLVVPSAPTSAKTHPSNTSTPAVAAAAATTTTATTTTNIINNDEKIKPNSAKSVFPLFFDVL